MTGENTKDSKQYGASLWVSSVFCQSVICWVTYFTETIKKVNKLWGTFLNAAQLSMSKGVILLKACFAFLSFLPCWQEYLVKSEFEV